MISLKKWSKEVLKMFTGWKHAYTREELHILAMFLVHMRLV
jgi:hypothetical protein